MEALSDSVWLTISGWVLTFLGIPLSIFLTLKFQKNKKLCWYRISTNLLNGNRVKFENFQATYKDEPIENISVAKILVWSAGREMVCGKDIHTKHPLRIEFDGGNNEGLLEATILTSNNRSSEVALEKSADDTIRINFDHLNHKDGLVIEVLHTGTIPRDIKVTGDLRGVGLKEQAVIPYNTNDFLIPKRFAKKYPALTHKFLSLAFGTFLSVLGVILSLFLLVGFLFDGVTPDMYLVALLFGIASIIMLLLGAGFLYQGFRPKPNKELLNIFLDSID